MPKVYLAEYRRKSDDGCFVFQDMVATHGLVFSEDYIPGFSLDQVKLLKKPRTNRPLVFYLLYAFRCFFLKIFVCISNVLLCIIWL